MRNQYIEQQEQKKEQVEFPVLILSLLIGFFADIKPINTILQTFGFSEEGGLMSLLYMAIIFFIFFIGIIINKHGISDIPDISRLIIVYIGLSFIITKFLIGSPGIPVTQLIVFCVCSFLIPFVSDVDTRILIKAIMFYPLFGIPRRRMIFSFVNDWDNWISMGVSYSFLLPIIATVIYISIYFFKESRKQQCFTLLLTSANLIYFSQLFQFGSRGPVVIVLGVVAFLVISPFNYSKGYGINIKKRLLLLGIILSLFVYFSFDTTLSIIQSSLDHLNISSHSIDKFVLLNDEGDISHGRDVITNLAIDGFWEKPILGHGLDRFDANTSMLYPHNAILQILYDGGILFFIIFIIPFISNLVNKFKFCDLNEYALYTLFLFGGLPGSMFSGNLWKQPLLWLFFGLIMSNSNIFQNNKKVSRI